MGINHFGFDPYVNDLYDGLRDGLIILQIMDLIHPGIVNWSRVVEEDQMAKGVQRKYEMLANCNYVITLGKQMGFSLVGISGQDIWEGNKTLTLALTWQLMRAHTLSLLKREKVDVTEEDLANAKYAISCGRRIGAPIYALPEDIAEDNPKMVFTTYAALKYTYDMTITKTTTFQAK